MSTPVRGSTLSQNKGILPVGDRVLEPGPCSSLHRGSGALSPDSPCRFRGEFATVEVSLAIICSLGKGTRDVQLYIILYVEVIVGLITPSQRHTLPPCQNAVVNYFLVA